MADKEKRIFEAETLGLPPLKMVLTEAVDKRDRNPVERSADHKQELLSKEDVVIRLIDHFNKKV